MKNNILTLLMVFVTSLAFSQNCTNVNTIVNSDYAYVHENLGLALPFNKDWVITVENEQAIIALLHSSNGDANAAIIRNKNGYRINSAHDIDENLINGLEKLSGVKMNNKKIRNVKLKNILAKEVEFDSQVVNLDETTLLSGVVYMIVKNDYTYLFMFNSLKDKKQCYLPFFKSVMKEAYFNQSWY